MNKEKGMSQVLSLIVAASVLMMVALSVIFLASGSLGDFGSSISSDSCTQSIRSTCQARQVSYIKPPSSCIQQGQGGGKYLGNLGNLYKDKGKTIASYPVSSRRTKGFDASKNYVVKCS